MSEYSSVAYLVERPAWETQAEQHSDTAPILGILELCQKSVGGPFRQLRNWEFGEGMDSARGVAAKVVFCHNSSCNSSCDAVVHSGRTAIAFFLLFRVQSCLFAIVRVKGRSKHVSVVFATAKCSSRTVDSHPLPISPLLHNLTDVQINAKFK